LAPATVRTFLIVIGRGVQDRPVKAIEAAITFARERLLPQDQVAVLAYNRATPFITDHRHVVGVLERVLKDHSEIDSLLAKRLQTRQYGYRDLPTALQVKIDRTFDPDGSRPPRSVYAIGLSTETAREGSGSLAWPVGGASLDMLVEKNFATYTDLASV